MRPLRLIGQALLLAFLCIFVIVQIISKRQEWTKIYGDAHDFWLSGNRDEANFGLSESRDWSLTVNTQEGVQIVGEEDEGDDEDSIYSIDKVAPLIGDDVSPIPTTKSTVSRLHSSVTDLPEIETDETPSETDTSNDDDTTTPPIETSLEMVLSKAGAQMNDILEVITSSISNNSEVIGKFIHLRCPPINETRYSHLIPGKDTNSKHLYFFALDLHQSMKILPRLMRSILQAIDLLGPENCVLSIVEGRSTDGTSKLLQSLENVLLEKPQFSPVAFHILKNDTISPKAPKTDRVAALASLRNLALSPLTKNTSSFSPDTTVIFINDIAICAEDILELLHQRIHQKADMMCGMDWIEHGENFYDVWIARTMDGDSFFEIPQDGGWQFASKIFWNDPGLKKKWEERRVFQVFSCWNGAVAFTAKPILEGEIAFRSARRGECHAGEPTLFSIDMWNNGFGKIGIVPSVNLGYEDNDDVQKLRGSVSSWIQKGDLGVEKIRWESEGPNKIKCWEGGVWEKPSWAPWAVEQNLSSVVDRMLRS